MSFLRGSIAFATLALNLDARRKQTTYYLHRKTQADWGAPAARKESVDSSLLPSVFQESQFTTLVFFDILQDCHHGEDGESPNHGAALVASAGCGGLSSRL